MAPDVASSDGRRYSPKPMPSASSIVVNVGDVPVALTTSDGALLAMLEQRFHRFLNHPAARSSHSTSLSCPERVWTPTPTWRYRAEHGQWHLRRGDFQAEWNPDTRRGWIRQTLNPYAADCVLRIVHTLLLSREGGFLLHASSAVRDGRAFLSPALGRRQNDNRPAGARRRDGPDRRNLLRATQRRRYVAFGTPFAGEWADVGEPVSAPVAAMFRLGPRPSPSTTALDTAAAVRTLMRNILFFAERPRPDASRARHGMRFRGARAGVPIELRAGPRVCGARYDERRLHRAGAAASPPEKSAARW